MIKRDRSNYFERLKSYFLFAAVLLTNIRNCLYPDEISQYFGVGSPSLEDYLDNQEVEIGLPHVLLKIINLVYTTN